MKQKYQDKDGTIEEDFQKKLDGYLVYIVDLLEFL
jgi:hypothetical protein